MIYLLGNKKIRLNPYNMRSDKCIGNGTTASVYLIDGKAYKLYNPFKDPELITKEKIALYKKIPTKRVILAEEALLNKKRQLRGYVSQYIENLGKDNLSSQSKQRILEELRILKEDFILLGSFGVIVHDAILNNTVYNEGAYLIDCGKFQTVDELSDPSEDPIAMNINAFNEYLTTKLFTYKGLEVSKYLNFQEIIQINLKEGREPLDFIEADMSEKENFGEYVKRKINY